jgi:hypothetical protein
MSVFDFDLSDMPDNPDAIGSGGGRPTPGHGMAIITAWNEYCQESNGQAHELAFEIVAWTTPADVGKTHEEWIYHADKTGKGFPKRRMLSLVMAAGLVTPAQYQRAKASGQPLALDLQQLVGKPIMVKLAEEPSTKDPSKMYLKVANIGLGWHHPLDPKVAAWPKDAARLQRLGITATAAAKPSAPPAQQQVTRPPAPPAKPVAASDDADPFADTPF